MDLMSSRLKSFGFGTRRNKHQSVTGTTTTTSTNNNNLTTTNSPPASASHIPNPSTQTLVAPPSNSNNSTTSPSSPPSQTSSSTTSLPMNNNQNALGRPPSYTYGRSASPLPPSQQLAHHPPPLNTNLQYTQPVQTMGPPPPGYGIPQQSIAPPIPPAMQPQPQQYMRNPVEVEGSGRSKAQLIVEIDFGTTFSGVAFAFATNNEAREDIITEWPGAGTHTKQKVGSSFSIPRIHLPAELT